MKKYKDVPQFNSEQEEREFWAKNDSTDYLDWDKAQLAIMPNLKPSSRTISLRLPEHLLDRIKNVANKKDIPYQSLIKVLLDESLPKVKA